MIFYPGAKVEYTSYLPLLVELSGRGVDCYLVQMPFNLALFGKNSADSVINEGNYSHYVIAGHSLGGVVAADYVSKTNKTDGVILLSAYPSSKINKSVLSVYGSQDNVLNMETYDESKIFADNFTEFVIEGGNHEQFAYYGEQSGDGVSNITPQVQQRITVDKILEFIHSIT